MTKDIWTGITVGGALAAYIAICLRTGVALGRGVKLIRRDREPGFFWLAISFPAMGLAFLIVLGLVTAFAQATGGR
jgi:hypothetical protein